MLRRDGPPILLSQLFLREHKTTNNDQLTYSGWNNANEQVRKPANNPWSVAPRKHHAPVTAPLRVSSKRAGLRRHWPGRAVPRFCKRSRATSRMTSVPKVRKNCLLNRRESHLGEAELWLAVDHAIDEVVKYLVNVIHAPWWPSHCNDHIMKEICSSDRTMIGVVNLSFVEQNVQIGSLSHYVSTHLKMNAAQIFFMNNFLMIFISLYFNSTQRDCGTDRTWTHAHDLKKLH